MCLGCATLTAEERRARHPGPGSGRPGRPWPHGRTPVSWRLRAGWPSEAQAAAVASTAEAVAVGRDRILELEARALVAEELLEARLAVDDVVRARTRSRR